MWSPATREQALARLFAAEQRFRARIAHRLDDKGRHALCDALKSYAAEVMPIDHTKGVAFEELAELVAPSYGRTFS